MLSGIKKGKRKRKANQNNYGEKEAPRAAVPSTSNNNLSVADQLRRSLAAGEDIVATLNDRSSSNAIGGLPHHLMERSGRIQEATKRKPGEEEEAEVLVVGLSASTASRAERLITGEASGARSSASRMSVDEEMARNVIRLGKKRKQKAKSHGDSDEEEIRQQSMLMPDDHPNKRALSKAKQEQADANANRRAVSREMSMNDSQDRIMSKCWWWLESSQFAKHRLVSLGNHVSLVMAPLNLSLTAGRHLYIVPIKHAESLVACEEEVWDEIKRFQTSLRNLFEKEYKQGVLFSETVLPTNNFWQSKMEVIPIKRKLWLDSELFFKSTLTEMADESNGTHNKLLSTSEKGLRRTIPKGFPYFFVEWDAPSQGYAQIIESSDFPVDFAADTIAGMAGMDPLRFKKKQKFTPENERKHILDFLEKWKKYDWTDALDD